MAEPFEMSLAAISKHLAILAGAGLISQDKRGRLKWCQLEPDALREAAVWMQGFGQVEPINLDAFERFLEAELSPGKSAEAVPGEAPDDWLEPVTPEEGSAPGEERGEHGG